MKNYLKTFAITLSLFAFSCGSDDSGNNGGDGGGLVAQATYRITFQPNFTAQTHPTDYPANAGFTKMMVVAHSSTTSIFSLGQLASDGLELYVETGDNSMLVQEHTQTEDGVNPTIIGLGNDIGPTGTDALEFTITPNTTIISFVSKVSPSPDWFVGVDSFNLANPDNTLVDDIEIGLFPIDGGTDGGVTYLSDDVPESAFISGITTAPFANANGLTQRLGTLRIERIDN